MGSRRFVAMFRSLVVVGDLDIEGVGIAPSEADSPFVVDSDAVLSLPIALQLLQSIPRRRSYVLKRHRAMQQQHFPPRHPLKCTKARNASIAKESLHVPRSERSNHLVDCIV